MLLLITRNKINSSFEDINDPTLSKQKGSKVLESNLTCNLIYK